MEKVTEVLAISNLPGIVRHPIGDRGYAEGAELAAKDVDLLPSVRGAIPHGSPDFEAEFVREVG
ncbi:hypothetical protein ABT352_03300 [Streptosporangium sp. NPDC000563]|uniref:hypothetical protein n=1 Tax=Streptosporangium sp. NPDC000563 TaxID=3154366 RepID=UPI0033253505